MSPPATSALIAFRSAAELGSFAAAARHLDMSAAAVGQAVQRLEDTFGVKLLRRTTRRMSVTPDGRLLLERCRGVLQELDDLARLFDESRGVIAGPLRVSAPLGFGRRHVLPLVARFLALHPGLEISLDTSDALRDFVGDHVDVAFRILRPADSALIARRVSRLEAVTVASPEYLRRHGEPSHPRDLQQHRYIAYRHPASGVLEPLTFRVRGRDTRLAAPVALVINDVETGCEAAARGVGIAQPPSDYVDQYIASGQLVPVLERFRAAPWTLYVCYQAAKHLPLRVRAFVEFVRRELGRDRFLLGARQSEP